MHRAKAFDVNEVGFAERKRKKKIVKIEEKGLQGSRAENSYPNNNTLNRLGEAPDCNYPRPRERGSEVSGAWEKGPGPWGAHAMEAELA